MKLLENMSPLERTQNVLDISTTERAAFRQCRRRWELEVLENLKPAVPPTLDLEFGSGIHAALEDYYIIRHNEPIYAPGHAPDALECALDRLDSWYEETHQRFIVSSEWSGDVIDQVLDNLVQLADLGEEILTGYDRFARVTDRFTVHAIEGKLTGAGQSWLKKHWEDREFISEHSASATIYDEVTGRLNVPILDPKSKRPIKDGPVLSLRLDLLVHSIMEGMKGLWVYDHKTCRSIPEDRGADFDDQVTSYCYGVWRWLGIVPRGFVFNYLAKRAPKEPRILKNGTLSTAKDQLTTAELYRQELQRNGLILKDGTIKEEKYADAYASFLSYGFDRFFQRHYVTRNKHEILSFEERLFEEWRDMADCFEGEMVTYPNFSRFYCPRCSVAPICQAIEDGSDWETVIDNRFMESEDRKALKLER